MARNLGLHGLFWAATTLICVQTTAIGDEIINLGDLGAIETAPTSSVTFTGRFDLSLDWLNEFGGGRGNPQYRNFHHFLFLNYSGTGGFGIFAELLDQTFYQAERQFGAKTTVVAGKILVPFGSNPFHQFYSGRGGERDESRIVPHIWGELGISVHRDLLDMPVLTLGTDVFAIRNAITEPIAADQTIAVGMRLTAETGRFVTTWVSSYFDIADTRASTTLMYAVDGRIREGAIPLPILRGLRITAGFVRIESGIDSFEEPTKRNYADYLAVSFRSWGSGFRPHVRWGTYADGDGKRRGNEQHLVIGANLRLDQHLELLLEHQINMEEFSEIADDLGRMMLVFEF